MRVTLLVLGVAALCAAALAQDSQRGRERLRELVLKARAGDAEAQATLASRRKNIARGRGGASPGAPQEQSAVAAVLGRGAPVAAEPQPTRTPSSSSRQRGESLVSRTKSRVVDKIQSQVTTFRPPLVTVTTPIPTTTTEQPILPPEEQSHSSADILSEPTFDDRHSPAEPQHVDLTPTNIIPSIFQSAQFGAGGRGVQPTQTITRQQFRQQAAPKPVTQRINQRAFQTGSTPHVNLVEIDFSERPKEPPVLTTRRYSYFDESGNFVFGYENEDGSFKEEIRGKDCIVNGKYGYIDPDGIRREFTYVSGNKCDPNNPEGDLLVDGVSIPKNDQFLHQTDARALTETELSDLAFNRRRKPVQQQPQDGHVVQNTRVTRPPAQRQTPEPTRVVSRPRPQNPQPELVRAGPEIPQAPIEIEVAPVDITPTNAIPSLFQPAQFATNAREAAPQRERFPVPDFLSSGASSRNRQENSVRQESTRRGESSRRQESRAQQTTQREELPTPPGEEIFEPSVHGNADLTLTNVVPSLFQPAQFGPGARGVQATQSVTRPPVTFDFNQEFGSVFSNFDNRAPSLNPRPTPRTTPRPSPRPTPRPTPPPFTHAPVTHPPPAHSNTIPSLFQPAQFGGSKPASQISQATPPIDDNSFVLSAQAPQSAPQLIFDASTGTFKSVRVQSTNPFVAASQAQSAHHTPGPQHTQPQPTQRPSTHPPPPPRAPSTFSQTTGRPLQIFSSHASTGGRSPLPPIPQSAADFDRFFAQFPTTG